MLIQVLRQQVPDHGFLGEEGGVSGNPESEYLWCIGESFHRARQCREYVEANHIDLELLEFLAKGNATC